MNEYQTRLQKLIDDFVDGCYRLSAKFPVSERFEASSQLRRASLSVALNYVEGYARRKPKSRVNFPEISYGSLKESKYLLHFALRHQWILASDVENIVNVAEEIGAMMWKEMKNMDAVIDG